MLSIWCYRGGVSLGARRSEALTFGGSSYGKGAGGAAASQDPGHQGKAGAVSVGVPAGVPQFPQLPCLASKRLWAGGSPSRGYSKLRQPSLSLRAPHF